MPQGMQASHSGDNAAPGGPVVKNPPVNAGDVSWIPGKARSPGVGNSNPF